jgi:sugar (pentulose or hexulose) kinase
MRQMLTIGIEAGTTAVRAAVFDDSGAIRATATRPLFPNYPYPGICEQDVHAVISAVSGTIKECVEASPAKPELLAITAQGDGLWLTDGDGEPVRPAILWNDTRAADYVEDWFQSGVAAAAFRRSGNAPFPGSAAALLNALADSEPDSLNNAATAGYCKDVLLQALTGVRSTDLSDASSPFLDQHSRDYDEAIIDLYRLRRWRHLLPPIEFAAGKLHALTSQGATLTGLPVGTPVHAGPFDFPATCIGGGLHESGNGLIALSSTLTSGVITDRLITDGEPSGVTISLRERDRWLRLLPATAGMSALDWFLQLIGVDYQELNALIASARPGCGGVITLPMFSTSGERAPFADAAARGRLIGLSTATTKADLARSTCEGIAYAARHCLESAGLASGATVTLCGGGSRASAFRQLMADILGHTVLLGRQPETAARGAVIAALETAHHPIDRETWTAPDDASTPSPDLRALYDEGYRRYREEITSARAHWSGPTLDA